MKQYCRYCNNCVYGDVVYCTDHNKVISETKAKQVNNCKYFVFNEIDVFDENKTYHPRTKKQEQKQIKVEELI